MWRNILCRCGGVSFVAISVALLAAVLWLRYGVIEAGLLPRDCGGRIEQGLGGLCGAKWVLVQVFLHQRLGWLSLLCAALAFPLGWRGGAWIGWLAGLAGLVLYSAEPAAVGALAALLMLARGERGQAEGQAGEQPGDGLGIGRLG